MSHTTKLKVGYALGFVLVLSSIVLFVEAAYPSIISTGAIVSVGLIVGVMGWTLLVGSGMTHWRGKTLQDEQLEDLHDECEMLDRVLRERNEVIDNLEDTNRLLFQLIRDHDIELTRQQTKLLNEVC